MRSNRYILIIFGTLIILGGGFLMIFKDVLADKFQERMIEENMVLLGEQAPPLPDIKETDVLDMDFLMKTKFKKLNNQVPEDVLNDEGEVGSSDSASRLLKQVIFE